MGRDTREPRLESTCTNRDHESPIRVEMCTWRDDIVLKPPLKQRRSSEGRSVRGELNSVADSSLRNRGLAQDDPPTTTTR